ncbi:hypothetical protein [Falsiroseomonas sp. CW058]|uniref:hypothetical protein n=1 Tax=Falsiroseomonas sp. CW058 TaxID=3388664 RepID=UPI003D31BB68
MAPGAWARARVRSVAARRGSSLTIRFISRIAGADPQPSPPMVMGPLVLGAAANPGDASISLRATGLVGRFVAGDRLAVAGTTYTVTASSTASAGAATVPISPPVIAPAQTGAPVTPVWAADIVTRAMVLQRPSRGLPGRPETEQSLTISLPAIGLPRDPEPGDIIIGLGGRFAVFDAFPEMQAETVVSWTLRAR